MGNGHNWHVEINILSYYYVTLTPMSLSLYAISYAPAHTSFCTPYLFPILCLDSPPILHPMLHFAFLQCSLCPSYTPTVPCLCHPYALPYGNLYFPQKCYSEISQNLHISLIAKKLLLSNYN